MDQTLASLQPVRESILRFLGFEETVSEVWLWASLGCCLFLLIYLPIWFLVRKRRAKSMTMFIKHSYSHARPTAEGSTTCTLISPIPG